MKKRVSAHSTVLALIRALVGQSNVLTIPRIFVDFTGSLETALFLSQLLYWSDKGNRGDGFVYKSRKEWSEEIALSDYTIRKATKTLVKMGLLETQKLRARGAPTLHYRLCQEKLMEDLIRFVENNESDLLNSTNGFVENNESDSSNSTNGFDETDESDLSRSTNDNIDYQRSRDTDIHKTTTTELAPVAAALSLESAQSQALDKLLQLGVQPQSTARRYATAHAPEQVIGWCEYALAEGLGAGYVRTMLDAGEPPPTSEEEPEHFVHVDYDRAERPPSPRELAMRQYGIVPEMMQIWDNALGELRLQMTKATFDTCLRGSFLLSVANGPESSSKVAAIGVRTAQTVDWLQNRLGKTVQRTLARHLDVEADQLELVFEVLQKKETVS